MKSIFWIGMAALLLSAPAAASETKRSDKQTAKRLDAMAKMTPEQLTRKIVIVDDLLEPLVTISTQDVFKWRGGMTDTVRSDNFVRATLDRPSGQTRYQLYQTITYTGAWRRFDSVNVLLPDGLAPIPLTVISQKIVTCDYGLCVYEEIVGFNLDENQIEAIAAEYSANPHATLNFRFKSNTGLDWNDDIAVAEIFALLTVVKKWRTDNIKSADGANISLQMGG